MVLRYLVMTEEAWEKIIKPAIEEYYGIWGLVGKYEDLPLAPHVSETEYPSIKDG